MNPILKNILAVISGLLIGNILNISIIMVSGSIIPPPEGADLTTMEGLTASMALMQPKHFIMPFLAHALGTLVGAFATALIAANHKMNFAMVIGSFFLIGGICQRCNASFTNLVYYIRFGRSIYSNGVFWREVGRIEE